MGGLELQLFLLGNVFVIGILLAIALLHWREHKHKSTQPKAKATIQPILPPAAVQRIIDKAEKEYSRTVEQTARELRNQLHTSTVSLHEQISKQSLKIINDELLRYQSGLAAANKETLASMEHSSKEVIEHNEELRTRLVNRQAAIELQLSRQQAELEAKFIAHSNQLNTLFEKRENEFLGKLGALETALSEKHQLYLDKQAELEAQLEQTATERRDKRLQQVDAQLNDAVVGFLLETLGKNVDLGAQLPYLTETLAANKEALAKELR